MRKLIILIFLSLTTINCTRVYLPTEPSYSTNKKDTIEFHVIGNALSAKVKYSSSSEGLNQIVTTLPFQVTLSNDKTSTFVTLEATTTGFPASISAPFLEIQIFVNGNLFREASTSSFLFDTIQVSGTFRRSTSN